MQEASTFSKTPFKDFQAIQGNSKQLPVWIGLFLLEEFQKPSKTGVIFSVPNPVPNAVPFGSKELRRLVEVIFKWKLGYGASLERQSCSEQGEQGWSQGEGSAAEISGC